MKKQAASATHDQGDSGDRKHQCGPNPSVPLLKFKLGDLCVTQNSKFGDVNNGAIVVIRNIFPGLRDRKGQLVPYRIERLDGSTFVFLDDGQNGGPLWFHSAIAVCAESKLRKLSPDEDQEHVESDLSVMEPA